MTVVEGSTIEPADLPKQIYAGSKQTRADEVGLGSLPLAEIAAKATEKAEREAISNALAKTNGNWGKAAELLGIGRQSLYRKLRQYGIE